MKFTQKLFIFIAVLLALSVALPLALPSEAAASIPPRRTIRVGLNFGNTALPSANLMNTGGFRFGFYDDSLSFTPLFETNETTLSVMVDRNMQWNPPPSGGGSGSFSGQYDLVGSNGLDAGPSRSPAIGCFHAFIGNFQSLEEANAAVGANPNRFIRYNAGNPAAPYTVLEGNFLTNVTGSYDSGTAKTITVAALGTDRILFEFDPGNTSRLFGIVPKNPGIPSTYRGYSYHGGFRYDRSAATALTISNIVGLEDYVKGVVPYEMSPSWPIEALKTQAICARTYVLASLNGKHNSFGVDVCTTADCQVYNGTGRATENTNAAVDSTAGLVVVHGGNLITTFYSSSHGGGSENNENVWIGSPLPYLRGVLDNYEESINISNYDWTYAISQSDITLRVRNAGNPNASTITAIRVSEYSPTGNAIAVTARDSNGREYTFTRRAGIQSLFGSNLRSIRFNIGDVRWSPGGAIYVNNPAQTIAQNEYSVITESGQSTVSGPMVAIDGAGNRVPVTPSGGAAVTSGNFTGPVNGNFILTGRGWGHSVGMSQWGAYAQALNYGRTAEQIIKHYFTGVEIVSS